ncbi:MAG: hypothetical protein ACLU4J_04910 [Butyricimonas paravirosa]
MMACNKDENEEGKVSYAVWIGMRLRIPMTVGSFDLRVMMNMQLPYFTRIQLVVYKQARALMDTSYALRVLDVIT